MANQQVKKVKPKILRQCREQIGLSVEQAEKKACLKTLASIEAGEKYPTINQIESLAKQYHVPAWVFLEEELPDKYCFNKSAAYRKFQNSSISGYEVRSVIANVERFRELLLELREDMEDPIQPFSLPKLIAKDFKAAAETIRQWLKCSEMAYPLDEWKRMLENNNVFIFTTGKYNGWSKVPANEFRGLSIYHNILPIIVINDSDTHKAQSFTLFHELGHLLKKQSVLDTQEGIEIQEDEEKWCDKFAGEVLMPQDDFLREIEAFSGEESLQRQLEQIDKLARKFKVSSYAFLVRMRHLNVINQSDYNGIKNELIMGYLAYKKKLKERQTIISRNRAREVLNQYGTIYSGAVVQTYRNQEIGLHKFCKLLGIRKVSDALYLETLL